MEDSYKKHLIDSYNYEAQIRAKEEQDCWKNREVEHFITVLKKYEMKSLIDLGCGSGKEALIFKREGFDVKCIDLSEEMIKICLALGLEAGCMDFCDIKYDNEIFDAGFAMSSLLHVPKRNITIVIEQIHRCLKINGILYVGLYKGFYEGLLPMDNNRYVAMYQTDELIRYFNPYFSILEVRNIRPDRTSRYLSLILQKK